MIRNLARRALNALLHPEIRLQADFPWGMATMAKQYGIATALYFLGNLIPLVLFFGGLVVLARINPELANALIKEPGRIEVGMVIAGFVCGFGLELWYIRRCFHKDGLTLRKTLGLNLDSLGGSWWAAIWRALTCLALVFAIEVLYGLLPLPAPRDPAGQFLHTLTGWGFLAMAPIVVVGAALFEELVFRGFLFNMLRTSFRKGRFQRCLRTAKAADYAAIVVSGAVFAGFHLTLTGFPLLFILGMVLAALYRRTGSLIPSMILHGLNNLVALLFLYFSMHS